MKFELLNLMPETMYPVIAKTVFIMHVDRA